MSIDNIVSKRNDRINYGIALLKMLMCFEVILIHFWVGPVTYTLIPFSKLVGLAVPTFMFLSFYFAEKSFLTIDDNKIKKRMWRIGYPQIGWALIYWSIYCILQIKNSSGITFYDLLWQILTGHSPKINPSMWFQTVLILLTIVYVLIFRLFKDRKGLILIFFITIFSLWFQYSGYNLMLFGSLRYELKFPLGRICEMFPYASIGFFTAHFDVFNRLKKYRLICVILFGVISMFLFKYNNIIPPSIGYCYSHHNNLLHVFFVVGFAFLLPFERFSIKEKNLLQHITRYTLGIYCMHRLIAFLLNLALAIIGLELNSFLFCVIIYIIAFCTSFVMCKLSSKYLKPLVE